MTTNACSGWDNSTRGGTDYCSPRCPRYIDDEGEAILIRPYREMVFESLLEMYDAIKFSTMALSLEESIVTAAKRPPAARD